MKKLIEKKRRIWPINLLRKKFFNRLAVIPALIFISSCVGALFTSSTENNHYIYAIFKAISVIVVSAILSSLLSALEQSHSRSKYARQSSIKGIVQAIQTVIYVIAAIFSVSLIVGVQIGVLLTTLGAASAVLMLVFKDSILGLVGGIQLSLNRMVLIGDWIEMPEAGADGTVLEISQISVKVQNFDNTIITIPTYDLITKPVKNWRGMTESGVRRIKRAVYIDMSSVQFCTDEMLAHYHKIQQVAGYIDKKQVEIDTDNKVQHVDTTMYINGRRQTNLGIFMAYLQHYLEQHPQLDQNSTLMARQLDPTESGLPIEIYGFIKTTEGPKYEAIQSDIFNHIIASIPYFDLKIFQHPSGSDYKETTNALAQSVRELRK
jgi:miniconductance mechanosensitive channel